MLRNLITFAHGLLCFAIIALVLLQRGKGADAGAGFGAGASGTVFGARGSATFFSKLTAVLATLFFMTSMSLAWFATRPLATAPTSIVDTAPPQAAGGVDADAVPALPDAPPAGAESPPPAPVPATE
ncbi:MAG: preprotein translocase subunit SecG [Steroidobacteraceae bacterium]|nr:preprotein translocase subunit SecG [Steroidobacteraceae bacterium]